MRANDCDWKYSFPQMSVISPDEIKEGLGIEEQEDPACSNPDKPLEEEAELEKNKEELEKFRADLRKD